MAETNGGPRIWNRGDILKVAQTIWEPTSWNLAHAKELLKMLKMIEDFRDAAMPPAQPRDELGRFLPRPRLEAVK